MQVDPELLAARTAMVQRAVGMFAVDLAEATEIAEPARSVLIAAAAVHLEAMLASARSMIIHRGAGERRGVEVLPRGRDVRQSVTFEVRDPGGCIVDVFDEQAPAVAMVDAWALQPGDTAAVERVLRTVTVVHRVSGPVEVAGG